MNAKDFVQNIVNAEFIATNSFMSGLFKVKNHTMLSINKIAANNDLMSEAVRNIEISQKKAEYTSQFFNDCESATATIDGICEQIEDTMRTR